MSRATKHNSVEDLEEAAAGWVFRRAGGLTAEEQAAFEHWRTADARHEAALMRHERAWSVLDRPRQAGQAAFLLEKLAQRTSRRRRRAGAIGATFAVLVAGATFWHARPPFAAPSDTQALSLVVLPKTQTLPDGSIVEMRSGAEIAVDFSGPLRRVVLERGEVHFQVAHQGRPFVVTAGNVEFRAVGTAFCVQLASAQVELLVTEGRVAVGADTRRRGDEETQRQGTEDGGQTSDLRPPSSVLRSLSSELVVPAGHRVVVGLAGELSVPMLTPSVVPLEEMAERLAWRAPKLEFTDTPLADAVALMNRHNRVKLVIEDANLGMLLVSGLFRADRTEAFVRLLEANFNVRTEQAGQTIYLRRKR